MKRFAYFAVAFFVLVLFEGASAIVLEDFEDLGNWTETTFDCGTALVQGMRGSH